MTARKAAAEAAAQAIQDTSDAIGNHLEPIVVSPIANKRALWMPYNLSLIRFETGRSYWGNSLFLHSADELTRYRELYGIIPYKSLLMAIRIMYMRCLKYEALALSYNGRVNTSFNSLSSNIVLLMITHEMRRLASIRCTTLRFALLARSPAGSGHAIDSITQLPDVMNTILTQLRETVEEVKASITLLEDLNKLSPHITDKTGILIVGIMRGCDARGEIWDE